MKYRDSLGRVSNNPYQQLINTKKYNITCDNNLQKSFSEIEEKEAQFEIDWLRKNLLTISRIEFFSYYLNYYFILHQLNIKVIDVAREEFSLYSTEKFKLVFNRSTLNVEKILNLFFKEFQPGFYISMNLSNKKTIYIKKEYSFFRQPVLVGDVDDILF